MKNLNEDDLWNIPPDDSGEINYKELCFIWAMFWEQEDKENKKLRARIKKLKKELKQLKQGPGLN